MQNNTKTYRALHTLGMSTKTLDDLDDQTTPLAAVLPFVFLSSPLHDVNFHASPNTVVLFALYDPQICLSIIACRKVLHKVDSVCKKVLHTWPLAYTLLIKGCQIYTSRQYKIKGFLQVWSAVMIVNGLSCSFKHSFISFAYKQRRLQWQ